MKISGKRGGRTNSVLFVFLLSLNGHACLAKYPFTVGCKQLKNKTDACHCIGSSSSIQFPHLFCHTTANQFISFITQEKLKATIKLQ